MALLHPLARFRRKAPRTPSGSPLLRCQGLSLRQAGGPTLIEPLDLQLRAGELLVLLGENGAGKTSLLRLLAGEPPAPGLQVGGTVELAGRPLADWSPRALARCRAVLPQHTDLAFDFHALEVVALARHPHGDPPAVARARAAEALAQVGASAFAGRGLRELSGGERARVFLAAALAQIASPDAAQPRLLLLDEPTAALDLAQQHRLLATVRDLTADSGVGVVAIVHDLNLAAQYADRVLLLAGGRRLAEGPPARVLRPALIARGFGVRAACLSHPLVPTQALIATARAAAQGVEA